MRRKDNIESKDQRQIHKLKAIHKGSIVAIEHRGTYIFGKCTKVTKKGKMHVQILNSEVKLKFLPCGFESDSTKYTRIPQSSFLNNDDRTLKMGFNQFSDIMKEMYYTELHKEEVKDLRKDLKTRLNML